MATYIEGDFLMLSIERDWTSSGLYEGYEYALYHDCVNKIVGGRSEINKL